jgi:hypothetical protein
MSFIPHLPKHLLAKPSDLGDFAIKAVGDVRSFCPRLGADHELRGVSRPLA